MIGRKSLEVRNTEDKNTHCQITVLLKTSNGSSLPTEYKQYILKLILKTLHFMTFSSFPIQPLVCTHEPSALTITDYYFPTTTFIFLLLECPPPPPHFYLAIIYLFWIAQLQYCFSVLLSSILILPSYSEEFCVFFCDSAYSVNIILHDSFI